MEKIYVAIGADCGIAGALRRAGKKTFSFPLDWLVSFHSVHKVFEKDFRGFLEDRVMNSELRGDANEFNVEYNIRFFHRELIKDYDATLKRRIDRLLEFMRASDREMIFIRRTHDYKHHNEIKYCGLSGPDEIDEVQDMMLLRDVLLSKYPKLKFKINLFLACPMCNKETKSFSDEHLNVMVSVQKNILQQKEEEFWDWVKTL